MTQAALTITQGNFPLIWASSTIQASCPHCEKRQMRSHTAIKCSWGLHNSALFAAPLREQEAVVSSRMKGTISTLNEILMVNAKFVGQDDERTSQKVRSDALEALPYRRTITTADSASANEGRKGDHSRNPCSKASITNNYSLLGEAPASPLGHTSTSKTTSVSTAAEKSVLCPSPQSGGKTEWTHCFA